MRFTIEMDGKKTNEDFSDRSRIVVDLFDLFSLFYQCSGCSEERATLGGDYDGDGDIGIVVMMIMIDRLMDGWIGGKMNEWRRER